MPLCINFSNNCSIHGIGTNPCIKVRSQSNCHLGGKLTVSILTKQVLTLKGLICNVVVVLLWYYNWVTYLKKKWHNMRKEVTNVHTYIKARLAIQSLGGWEMPIKIFFTNHTLPIRMDDYRPSTIIAWL